MLKRLAILFWLMALLGPILAQQGPPEPPQPEQRGEEQPRNDEEGIRFRRMGGPVLFGNFLLKTNEAVGDLVVIGGNAEIEGIVEGSLVVVGGSVRVSGTVEGEMVVVLGGATVEDGARLERDVVLIGGPFEIAEGAELERKMVQISLGNVAGMMEGFKEWLFKGLFLGRLLPVGIGWAWVTAGVFAALYLAVLLIFPGAVTSTVTALETRPVTSVAVGMLTLVLLPPLMFLLAVSVVGVAVIPFLELAVVILMIFGKAGLLCLLGRSMGRSVGAGFLQRLLPAFLIGLALITVAYMVPVVGLLAWAVGTVFGLGAAVVALSSSFQREETAPPAPLVVRPQAGTGAGGANPPPATGEDSGGTASAAVMAPPPAVTARPGDTILLARAGFWSRFLAALLDWVLLSLLIPVTGPVIVLLAVGYFVGMWTWKGTTIGGIVMSHKVVRTDGMPVSLAVALVRSLSSIFSAMMLGLGFLWAAWDGEKQSWHDKIAGTVVVKMPKDLALI